MEEVKEYLSKGVVDAYEYILMGQPDNSLEVLLDGVIVSHVFHANAVNGFVERFKINEKGNVYTEEGEEDAANEKLYGVVEFIFNGEKIVFDHDGGV